MTRNDFRAELKRIFTGYKHMTARIESELQKLGISVSRKRNHAILQVPNGSGYRSVSVSVSGSDKRAGLNVVTEICRAMS